jgi:hypothetical protein
VHQAYQAGILCPSYRPYVVRACTGVCFYQRESLPGYSAIFKHPNEELNFCYCALLALSVQLLVQTCSFRNVLLSPHPPVTLLCFHHADLIPCGNKPGQCGKVNVSRCSHNFRLLCCHSGQQAVSWLHDLGCSILPMHLQ